MGFRLERSEDFEFPMFALPHQVGCQGLQVSAVQTWTWT